MIVSRLVEQDVSVVGVAGRLMGGPESADLQQEIQRLMQEGRIRIVLDIGGLEWMNSSGIGLLVGVLTTVRKAGGDLRLARPSDKVSSLFTLSKLHPIFQTHATVREAVDSYR